jgi:hypothetical protein
MGMIGESKLVNDPNEYPDVKRFSKEEILAAARPGDIFAVSKPGWENAIGKIPQVLTTGSEFYHVEPVVDKRGKNVATIEVSADGIAPTNTPPLPYGTETIKKKMSKYIEQGDLALLRPKFDFTPEQKEKYLDRIKELSPRPYDDAGAVSTWLNDIFVPKPLRRFTSNKTNDSNICSTFPAQALFEATGRRVQQDVSPNRTLPVDYLRDNSSYELVGATDPQEEKVLKNPLATRLASRGLIGAALAGAAYGLYRNPHVITGAIGGALTPLAIRGMSGSSRIPTYKERAMATMDSESDAAKQVSKDFLTKSVPLALAGGVGSYAVSRGIARLLSHIPKKLR